MSVKRKPRSRLDEQAPAGKRRQSQIPIRHVHRERDFGIGYGNSSGYGRENHYANLQSDALFRCR